MTLAPAPPACQNMIKFPREGSAMITKREFYVNGAWVAPLVARDCPVIDPSTEDVCAVISLGSEADTNAAVAAAKAAFPAWAATSPAERRRVVRAERDRRRSGDRAAGSFGRPTATRSGGPPPPHSSRLRG